MKDHEIYMEKIQEMIESNDYNWALDFLESVYDQCLHKSSITEKQMESVDNIENSKNKRY